MPTDSDLGMALSLWQPDLPNEAILRLRDSVKAVVTDVDTYPESLGLSSINSSLFPRR